MRIGPRNWLSGDPSFERFSSDTDPATSSEGFSICICRSFPESSDYPDQNHSPARATPLPMALAAIRRMAPRVAATVPVNALPGALVSQRPWLTAGPIDPRGNRLTLRPMQTFLACNNPSCPLAKLL